MTIGWIIVSTFSTMTAPSSLYLADHPQHSSSAPAWLRYSPQYLPPVVPTSGLTCSLPKRMLPSLPGLLVGKTPPSSLLSPPSLPKLCRFNLLGQVAVTTGIDFGLANLISTTAEVSNGYNASSGKTLGILAVVLLSHVLINMFSVRTLRYMIYTSIVLNTLGVSCMAIAVLSKAPTHRSADFVFATFNDSTGPDGKLGWSKRASPAYVAVVGVLISQYTILGFDASAHLCEETRKAVKDAPIGLLSSIAASSVIGFFLITALLFSIQDFEVVQNSPLPVLQILTDACGKGGGLVLMVMIMLCVWHCGLFSLVRNPLLPSRS